MLRNLDLIGKCWHLHHFALNFLMVPHHGLATGLFLDLVNGVGALSQQFICAGFAQDKDLTIGCMCSFLILKSSIQGFEPEALR